MSVEVSTSSTPAGPQLSIVERLTSAWLSKKGTIVFIAWGTALSGITLWSYSRRGYEKRVQSELVEHHPHQKAVSRKRSKSKSFFAREIVDIHSEQRWSLWHLRHRLFPNWTNPAVAYSVTLPCVMLSWFYARNRVKKHNSRLASYLCNKEWELVFKGTVDFAMLCIPASVLAKCMSTVTQRIGLNIRTNLVRYYQRKYLCLAPYILTSMVDRPDQRLTNDIDKFAHGFAELYNSILWSVGGCVMLSLSLMKKMGWKEFAIAIGYSFLSRRLVTFLSPSFSDLTENVQLAEAQFRGTHSQIAEYVEEIQILGGGEIEAEILDKYHDNVELAYGNYYMSTMVTEMFGSYFTGELGNLVGYITMIPAIYLGNVTVRGKGSLEAPKKSSMDTVQYLTTVVQELSFLTKLFERVFRIGKKFSEVSGLAHRIVEVEQVMNELIADRSKINTEDDSKLDYIELEKVSISTPLGELLIRNLNLKIEQGDNLIICGPNGVGKTSIFRVIAGLWRVPRGIVRAPVGSENMFLLSQRPYIVPGLTLREQITYPKPSHTFAQEHILEMVDFVGLTGVMDNRGGLDSTEAVVGLSGGERQRIGMARCLLHCPKFALLDECTSMVSNDVESDFFEKCRKLRITIISIAHRLELKRYHKYCLDVSRDAWKLSPIQASELSVDESSADTETDDKDMD